ncbi:MAG: prolyl oligopeptidase family serine peptidase [Pseudomonadota bacterium]
MKRSTATTSPYGTWASPISASLAAASSNAVLALQLDGDDLYWLESRPLEGGRTVVAKHVPDAAPVEITSAEVNVRTRVHEYGGVPFVVVDGTLYFSNFADQALYEQRPGAKPVRRTQSEGLRFADCAYDPTRDRLLCVREDHREDGEAVNTLVAVERSGAAHDGDMLWQGSDFVAYPRVSADGRTLAWISWDHPNMPWDNVSLWVAPINTDGALGTPRRVNEGMDESVLQPEWAEDGTLYFLADRSGWWNLHRFDGDRVEPVHEVSADLGGPLWSLGSRFYGLLSAEEALIEFNGPAGSGLGVLDLKRGDLRALSLPYVTVASLVVRSGVAYFLGGLKDGPSEVVALEPATGEYRVLHRSGESGVEPGYLASPEAITFPTAGGAEAYAYYYPPTNADFQAPEGELPPLMVLMHGGPTGATSPNFSLAKQFWTSRGFAIVDVNYRGSTGYGRAFRQALNGQWGVVDLEDAVAATEYLVANKKADPDRLLIRGGSAGGYTTLSALAFTDVFAAGANYFGVSDLKALAEHTHKFESRYLDSMVGPYPEAADLYAARSPINALDGFNSPLITFQGLEDRVVPPAQSEMIYEALKAKGTPTAYLPFEGEQHGFRSAENNIKALESELYFYGKVLGFEPAGTLPAVTIDNLGD